MRGWRPKKSEIDPRKKPGRVHDGMSEEEAAIRRQLAIAHDAAIEEREMRPSGDNRADINRRERLAWRKFFAKLDAETLMREFGEPLIYRGKLYRLDEDGNLTEEEERKAC